jgi:hypothetical protein
MDNSPIQKLLSGPNEQSIGYPDSHRGSQEQTSQNPPKGKNTTAGKSYHFLRARVTPSETGSMQIVTLRAQNTNAYGIVTNKVNLHVGVRL